MSEPFYPKMTVRQRKLLRALQARGMMKRQQIADLLICSIREANEELNGLILRGSVRAGADKDTFELVEKPGHDFREQPTLQLGDICERLGVRAREVRYVLEQGHVPAGVNETPESGNHRQFRPGQAFWLGMVLKLKEIGIKTPLAARIADYAAESLQTVTKNLGWDWEFCPWKGQFDTDHEYFVEVGDLKYIRFVTDACPSRPGRLYEFDWHNVKGPSRPVKNIAPCAVIRLRLTQIARLLADSAPKSP